MAKTEVRPDNVETAWFFIRTPDTFVEFSLPMRSENFTKEDKRNLKKLCELSETNRVFIERHDASQAPAMQGLVRR